MSCVFVFLACGKDVDKEKNASTKAIKNQINLNLNNWHEAASKADFTKYFSLMTNDGVFIGTDATENWQNKAFKTFCTSLNSNG